MADKPFVHIERNPQSGYRLPWLWFVLYGEYYTRGAADTKQGATQAARQAARAKAGA